MARRSNKTIAEVLKPRSLLPPSLGVQPLSSSPKNDDDYYLVPLQRKIAAATEDFITSKFCELILKDRDRLSKENALTVSDYIIAMNENTI